MKRFLSAVVLLLACLAASGGLHAQGVGASPTPAIQNGGETAAKAAADIWLALVDDTRYEPAYQSAASIFQKLVTKEQWIKLAGNGRSLLGRSRSRVVQDTKFSATMPGAPDGQYVVIHYQTSFEKKAAATETVTTLLDSDGQWKVCGYFIR